MTVPADVDAILDEVRASYVRLKQAEARARFAYEHYLDGLKEEYDRRWREIEEQFAQSVDAASPDVPSPLTRVIAPWSDPVWASYAPSASAPPPAVVRVGRLELPAAVDLLSLPALAPLAGSGHLFIEGDSAAARSLLQGVLLRMALLTAPGSVVFTLIDPLAVGANLAMFLPLPETVRGPKVWSRPEDIDRQLQELSEHVETVIQRHLVNKYASVEEYNEGTTAMRIPYRILALTDFPAGFTERSAAQLVSLARTGPRAGVYIVASMNRDIPWPRDFRLEPLASLGVTLRFDGPSRLTWNDPEFGQYPVVPDELPPPANADAWLSALAHAVEEAGRAVGAGRATIAAEDRWSASSAQGLSIPIGVGEDGEPFVLDLFNDQKGEVYHGLIGGIVRSGKSNLLHVLITQLALSCSPEELELYLVDLKEGVEFAPYLDLPHARAVVLESEREFALSVLQHLKAQIEERGRLFSKAGVANFTAYRESGRQLARLLLMIDEFQVLFAEDDRISRDAAAVMEDIVRRGAGFGMHLLLCSQSPSVAGMWGQRIYNQMNLRIALRCRPQDAQAILGESNDAASRLQQRGDAIVNTGLGAREHNRFVRISHVAAPDQVVEEIRALAGSTEYPAPVTLESRTPARLEENAELHSLLERADWPAAADTVQVWLGQPVEMKPVTAATLERYMRSNLLIAGGDEEQGYGLLTAAVISLAAQRSPADARFAVLDFARPASPAARVLPTLRDTLPHQIELAGERGASDMLTHLVGELDARLSGDTPADSDVYCVIAGLHRWRDLLRSLDQYGMKPSEAATQLLRLLDEGPEQGLHVIVWADGFTSVERAVKTAGMGMFDNVVAFRLPEGDSKRFPGVSSPLLAARLQDNRALFRYEDWEQDRVEKFKPCALPHQETLAPLLAGLRGRAPE